MIDTMFIASFVVVLVAYSPVTSWIQHKTARKARPPQDRKALYHAAWFAGAIPPYLLLNVTNWALSSFATAALFGIGLAASNLLAQAFFGQTVRIVTSSQEAECERCH